MQNINAKEILEIAIQNEKNGAKFYSKLIDMTKHDDVKEALKILVKDENNHISIIKGLLNDLLEEGNELSYYDDPEELLYLQSIAGSVLFSDDPASTFEVKVALDDVFAALHYAVGVEIKSIEFYKQVLQVMPPNSGQELVEKLIEQEKGHVNSIYAMIKRHE